MVSDGIYRNEIVDPYSILGFFLKGASEFTCDNDANDETKSTKEKQKTIVFIAT